MTSSLLVVLSDPESVSEIGCCWDWYWYWD